MNQSPDEPEAAPALHRSGAVARLLRMPVATLRVWERRYALTSTARSPSGQRLYSADDLRRLALLKQLSDLGHAIGGLAALDLPALLRVASSHAQAVVAIQARPRAASATAALAWRLAVVGPELGARLRRPTLLRQIGRPVQMLGPFNNVAEAAAAERADGRRADAWLLHQPQLHDAWRTELEAALSNRPQADTPNRAPVPVAVLFGYAADAVCDALAADGVTLLREPQPDVVLASWLRMWAGAAIPAAAAAAPALVPGDGGDAGAGRRWSDAALAEFAAQSSGVACECPRQVAELLLQVAHFEVYSRQCAQRSPEDAELHALLGRVAADARGGFEMALEQVALREGLLLPAQAPAPARPRRPQASTGGAGR